MELRRKAAWWVAGAGITAGVVSAAVRNSRSFDMHNDVVLITGGSRGLGLAMAAEFGGRGCRIAVCARDSAELESARAMLAGRGVDVHTVRCDVSDQSEVNAMLADVRNRFGRIDTLINNAGVIRVAPLENMNIDDFEQAMDVMFWGVVYPTLGVLEEMRRRGKGRIATITSIGGKVSVPHLLPYCCAKFAAVGFTEGLRAEVARHGIRVTTIAPGLMRTGSYRKAEFKGRQEDEAFWFQLCSTLPGISMGAERAARQIACAVSRGASEKIMSTQASLLARVNGALPGLVPALMAGINQLLPAPAPRAESVLTGAEAENRLNFLMRALTARGRQAARRFNETSQL